jgi:hypothetical protein
MKVNAKRPREDQNEPPINEENRRCNVNTPINVKTINPFILFMNQCDGTPISDSINYPKLQLPDEDLDKIFTEPSNYGPQQSGLKAPISIVKVRKNAWETLSRGLETYSEEYISNKTGIYNYNSGIRIVIKKNQEGLLDEIDEQFNLCELGKVFLNSNEDEIEDSDEIIEDDDEDEDKYNTKAKGLTRENLRDSNPAMKNVDEAMLKIISILFILTNTNSDVSSNARKIIKSFIVASSAKEYLDVGQLYAICDPLIEENKKKGYESEQILNRCATRGLSIFPGQNGLNNSLTDIKVPRKPMLETIDGAATRIAANQYFTAYCKFMLKNNNNSLDASFYIDNKYVYTLSLILSNDESIILYIDSEADKKGIKNEIDTIRNLLKNENTNIQIDTCYYILKNKKIRDFLTKDIGDKLSHDSDSPKNVLLIDIEKYFIASLASFLYKYDKDNNIVEGLLDCNFDSLCHDNGESKIYRLIMILTFILKNDTQQIKRNLKDMFPSFFDLSTNNFKYDYINSTTNSTSISGQFIFLNPKETSNSKQSTKTNYYKYMDYILTYLSDDQKNIFKILASRDAHKVENGLYLRLLKKNCYVFQVLHTNLVAVVRCAKSAHKAFQPAQEELKSLKNIFKIQSLDQGVFIPHYTSCAIDAPLKHGLSLSSYDIKGLNSEVIVTAVTRNDAASQNMTNSLQYTKPICMKINIKNMKGDDDIEGTNSFTYQFMYGKTTKVFEEETIDKEIYPEDLDENYKQKYKQIISNLRDTLFFFNKRNVGPFKDEVNKAAEKILSNISSDQNAKINEKEKKSIRDALSRLNTDSICGKLTNKNSTCSLVKIKSDKIVEGKTLFLKFFIDFLSNGKNSLESKKLLINNTLKLLEFTNETKNLDNLMIDVNDFINPTNNEDNDEYNNEYNNEEYNVKRQRQIGGFDFSSFFSNNNSENQQILEPTSQPYNTEDQRMFTPLPYQTKEQQLQTPKFPQIVSPTIEPISGYDKAKGMYTKTDNKLLDKNRIISENVKLTYTSMFGKYGFDMEINEDGEYELKILNTEEDYTNYLKNYDINENTRMNINENTPMDINENTRMDINENTPMDINENTRMDINENTRMDINENRRMDINENRRMDINENSINTRGGIKKNLSKKNKRIKYKSRKNKKLKTKMTYKKKNKINKYTRAKRRSL